MAGYVYFLECDKFIKIGISTNLANRLVSIAAMNPYEICVLAIIERSDSELSENEKELHRRFNEYRLHGEWFTKSVELVGYIGELKINDLVGESNRLLAKFYRKEGYVENKKIINGEYKPREIVKPTDQSTDLMNEYVKRAKRWYKVLG